MYKALTIAGSDSGGCAGIQADLKTFTALGVFGTSAITALTSQNTLGVTHIMPTTPESVTSQIDAVLSDIGADAVKTGMLFSSEIICAVSEQLKAHNVKELVVDPVMVATTGAVLLQDSARAALVEQLFPIASVITPNKPEAELLTGVKISDMNDVHNACKRLVNMGARAVVLKGGHITGDKGVAVDILYDGANFQEFSGAWTDTKNLHGTGCTYSAAIATYLAQGHCLNESIRLAKKYITGAIATGAKLSIGRGVGPVNHLWMS
ncbi:hypothetical protein RsTz2092_05400 [Deferribacterales bacterium RsTz2092]|nr:hypothetical protein AGMMS49941_00530 [Deferribacterales bacterium]